MDEADLRFRINELEDALFRIESICDANFEHSHKLISEICREALQTRR